MACNAFCMTHIKIQEPRDDCGHKSPKTNRSQEKHYESNKEEQWWLRAFKMALMFNSSSLTKLLPLLSITKRGNTIFSMEPGTGVNLMARKGIEWRKEAMQKNALKLTKWESSEG